MTPLEQVTEKIWELLPDDRKCIDGKFDEMITLEDVLIAFQNVEQTYCIGVDGGFWKWTMGGIVPCKIQWQLGKPLHEQEEETILFLNEIL